MAKVMVSLKDDALKDELLREIDRKPSGVTPPVVHS
jgi:hypothetical protein